MIAIGSLAGKRLVNKDGTSALCRMDKKFFTLPNEIFLLRLPPSALLVYAYLLLIEDRQSHTCHPSYNTIAVATRISKNTAMKSVGVLLEMELITVQPSSYFDKYGLQDNRPPTRRQEQLIKKLTKDFPDSKTATQYVEYTEEPTKYRASAFITSALENHWPEASQSEVYIKYIATRPRAERLGHHGLFGDEDAVATTQMKQDAADTIGAVISGQM